MGAYLAAPLVVEVRDSTGAPTRDTLVEFGTCCGVMVSGDTLPIDYSADAILRTDNAGRTRTYVQLGTTPESVYVSVHALGDSNRVKATYLVLVGNLARIVIGIPDSAAYVGQGYRVPAHAGDRFANYRPDPLSYVASDSVLSVDSTGRLTAQTIGRGAVVIRAGTIVDSAWVTVPPRGVIGALDVQVGPGTAAGIVTFQLDGSDYRIIDSTTSAADAGSWPTWTPSGDLLFSAGGFGSERLYLVDTLGGPRRRAIPTSPVPLELFGSMSRNGSWLYFSSGNDLWRAMSDGSSATNLGVDYLFANAQSRPAASADGALVAVLSDLAFSTTTDVTVVAPDSGTVTPLHVGGGPALPRWSPNDSLVLFWKDSALWVTTPSGLGTHQVSPIGVQYLIGEDWSPDGKWLITRRPNLLELLNLATGERLPLPYGIRFVEPSWGF